MNDGALPPPPTLPFTPFTAPAPVREGDRRLPDWSAAAPARTVTRLEERTAAEGDVAALERGDVDVDVDVDDDDVEAAVVRERTEDALRAGLIEADDDDEDDDDDGDTAPMLRRDVVPTERRGEYAPAPAVEATPTRVLPGEEERSAEEEEEEEEAAGDTDEMGIGVTIGAGASDRRALPTPFATAVLLMLTPDDVDVDVDVDALLLLAKAMRLMEYVRSVSAQSAAVGGDDDDDVELVPALLAERAAAAAT